MSISLKEITLFNFKSFRGKVVINSIQPFTVINGPNGSGKSNIVDAINFALGATSSALRVKHLSKLIHGAFIGKPAIESTYVTLVFIGDHNKEKSFTRLIQGRGSQYKIDGKIVDYNYYVTELDKFNLNIKAKNFFMPQGHIHNFETIFLKELTVLLEELSGSNIYKANYERLQLELSQIEEEIQFVYKKKTDVLTRKKFAMAETKEVEKYLQMQRQYMEQKEKLQLIKLFFIKKIFESLKKEEAQLKLEIDGQLQDKENIVSLSKQIELKIISLSNSLEELEDDILQINKNFQEKSLQKNNIKDNMSYLQNRRNSAITSLESIDKENKICKKTIHELKDNLEFLNKKLAEFEVTMESTSQIDNEQVSRYLILKTEVECLTKDTLSRINDMMHHKQTYKYKLDNEIRCKEEILIDQQKKKLEEEHLQKQIKHLEHENNDLKSKLKKKKVEELMLQKKISEAEERYSETRITEISKRLDLVESDNDFYLQWEKKVAIIKHLKESFSGVDDRLSNLCTPIHSRYNVAITKVFGKNMDSIVVDTVDTAKKCIKFLKRHKIGKETFLPLDTIKSKPLNEKLRAELEFTNFKLLFDVLKISSTQISKAVLHVTEDILVCETDTEAREKAYRSDVKYDCVSLDGCFFRKSGIISGGLADLTVTAKQWENIPLFSDISVLKEQEEQLRQELKNLPNISKMQVDLDIIDKDINQLIARSEVIERDIRETERKISEQKEKLNDLNETLHHQDMLIISIKKDIEKIEKKIKNEKNDIDKIENEIFMDFCKDNNLPNISSYENSLCTYKEQMNKKTELITLRDNIENHLDYERSRDTEIKDKILEYNRAIEQAEAEYNKACEQERDITTALKEEEKKMVPLNTKHTALKNSLQKAKDEYEQCKLQIDIITKKYLERKKTYLKIEEQMAQKEFECENILKECKIEDINIPALSEAQNDLLNTPSVSTTSTLSRESGIYETLLNIDFSQISKDVQNYNKMDLDNLQKIIKHSEEIVIELQSQFQTLKNPNFKAYEELDLTVRQLKELTKKNQNLHVNSRRIKIEFEQIKAKRLKQFSDCLDFINAEIDSIYKNLVDNSSAQALIITKNPEEPYKNGLIYSCLPPSKRFLEIQYLSDGEKTLASLALLFAMIRYKPTPFFVMDEGDAALDIVNAKKLARFITTEKKNVQFIMISLNNEVSSYADTVVGVTTEPNTECLESKVFCLPLR